MDPVSITAGVITGVSGLLSIYKEGRRIYEKWRNKKKAKKAAEEELQNSLEKAPDEVNCQRKSLSRIHGLAFDQGDEISHASLKTISEALTRTLLEVLKESLHLGHRSELEPERLWKVSNAAREDAIGTLMDLHRRLMVKAPISRPIKERRSATQILNSPDSLRVSHPPPPRHLITATSQDLVHCRPEDVAVVPFGATNTSVPHSSLALRASSLSLRPSYRDLDYQTLATPSTSISARFRDSVSSSLELPTLGGPSGKTAADLLREWKNDIDERRLSSLTLPITPPSPLLLTPNYVQQSQSMMRHSSAPSTPCSSHRSSSPIREVHQLSSTISRPGLQYNREGMVITGQRHRSDSYVPNAMGTRRMVSTPSPTTNLESGFTYNLPSNSAKASVNEFFPSIT